MVKLRSYGTLQVTFVFCYAGWSRAGVAGLMSGLLLLYCLLIVVYCACAYRSLSRFSYYLYRVGNMIIRCLRAAGQCCLTAGRCYTVVNGSWQILDEILSVTLEGPGSYILWGSA